MRTSDLNAFNELPFLFWVKDERGTYLWGNKAINDLAGQDVAGKTDDDLPWAANAGALQANDRAVLESGRPHYMHERVDKSERGGATLNACKWADDLDGKRRCFGISFVID